MGPLQASEAPLESVSWLALPCDSCHSCMPVEPQGPRSPMEALGRSCSTMYSKQGASAESKRCKQKARATFFGPMQRHDAFADPFAVFMLPPSSKPLDAAFLPDILLERGVAWVGLCMSMFFFARTRAFYVQVKSGFVIVCSVRILMFYHRN